MLLIAADQLRYDSIEPSGLRPVRTPHLSKLAKEGATFRNAFTHFPVCCPARQSLLHGRRPETFGALWNYSGALPVASLRPEAFSWPRTLAELGYASAYLGKWGVSREHDATAFGYDVYVGEEEYASFAKAKYPDVSYAFGYFGETSPIPVEDASTHWFARRAVDELERLCATGRPWHMSLHFAEPHLPCRPSGPFADMYDPASIEEWPGFRDSFEGKPYIQRQQLFSWGIERFEWNDWAPIVARYFGVISQLDDAVGLVLDALERLGAADRTVVVFTADHGDMCGSHRMMDKHYVMYDDVLRVPLLIRWPGRVPAQTRDEFVYPFLDWAPTLLDMLGAPDRPPGGFHGTSLAPMLTGDGPPIERKEVVATYNGQQFGLYTQRAIRTERWKYVWNTTDVDELYDLKRDPAELENRIRDDTLADVVRELRLRLYEALRRDGDPLVGNEWTRRQLVDGRKIAPR